MTGFDRDFGQVPHEALDVGLRRALEARYSTIDHLDGYIEALARPGAPASESFGINLVANTSPMSIGANPDQGQFGQGVAHPDYATPNKYHYNSGDIIASAPKSSGLTKFTVSYRVNVAPLTKGGAYQTHQTIIVIGTY